MRHKAIRSVSVGIVLSAFSMAAASADTAQAPSTTPSSAATPAATPSQSNREGSTGNGKIPYSSLTPDERGVLARGEIDQGSYIAGGLVGTFFGLGIGQAIEGRYWPTGAIITVGELASTGLIVAGAVNCTTSDNYDFYTNNYTSNSICSSAAKAEIVAGLIGLIGFRVWEVIDVWATPPSINQRYHELRSHVAEDQHASQDTGPSMGILPASAQGHSQIDGASLALRLRF